MDGDARRRRIAGLNRDAIRLQTGGDRDAARRGYKAVLNLDPANPTALCNIAVLYRAAGEQAKAHAAGLKSILAAPAMAAAYNNLANFYRDHSTCYDRAIAMSRCCNTLSPFYAEGYNNHALTAARVQDHARSMRLCRKALALDPALPDGWLNHANAIFHTQAIPRSNRYYRRSLFLRPRNAAAVSSFGVSLAAQGHVSVAVEMQERAIRIDPKYEEAWFNLALYYLHLGRFAEGFKLYEHGIGGRSAAGKRGNPRRVAQKRWQGESLAGRTVLVTTEQGIGDEIMFGSLVPELQRLARKVHLEVTPRLHPIFARSLPGVEVFAHNPENPSKLLASREIDFSLPLGSLALFFRRTLSDFGRQRPYLEANPHLTRHFRAKYATLFPGRKLIGISWRGGTGAVRSKSRSIELDRFAAILKTDGVQGISIQYGERADPIADYNARHRPALYDDPEVDPLHSMEAAMSQIAALDMVISVTNAGVHSAGALGVPCWILVPHISDWRWTWGRRDVVWYPGMRCFRQSRVGDWDGPLAEIETLLAECLAGRAPLRHPPSPDMDWSGRL